ncbi:sensor histidine kinase [Miniphocaeibacter halophilus]|uniref:HAMP domain-containing histidine kinase n=1 Tax=Miniphocaeibacter halophilus TaxID=2931922 RepID=A0AC61MQW9_9FIRM|nr:HAMP domain-containing sensor histidine kinase [Miniphocaeibacter halophilus]QQK07892.1 HAMP domain-containing histidine kinase [Miniphocaeibacter halophilus]
MENTKTVGKKILEILKKIALWFKRIFDSIDGYIEDQIFYLVLFFGIQYLLLKILTEILSKGIINIDGIFKIYVVVLLVYKFYKTIKKYGIHSFLIIDFILGFRFKYFMVYLECLVIELFLIIAFLYIRADNEELLGIYSMAVIIQKISASVMENYLGKVLLNRKIEALNDGKNINVSIIEDTYSESIYLIDHLYDSMKKSLDAKYKSERLKTDLITNISHDLKTPLTSIINYVDIVKNTDNEEEREKYINILDFNAKRLKAMVIDLIDASKTGTGNVDLNYEIIELNELILQVYGQFDARFEEKNLEFDYDSFSDNIFINVDGDQLSRVFENLIGNAVNYSKENSKIIVRISVSENHLIISLSNETEEKIDVKSEDLLEQFVRGEKSRSSEGSGLGLYISKNIIELMKGKLNIKIEDNRFVVLISFKIKTNKKKVK